jgi:hypothetical protein
MKLRTYKDRSERRDITKSQDHTGVFLPPPFTKRLVHAIAPAIAFCHNSGQLLYRVWRQVLPLLLLLALEVDLVGLCRDFAKDMNDIRGPHTVLNAGTWLEAGGKGLPNVIKFSQTEEGKAFAQRHFQLFDIIARIAYKLDPDYVSQLQKIHPLHREFSIFSYMVFNLTSGMKRHRDNRDFAYCWVFVFGEFSGGELEFIYLNTKIQLRPGDLICFKSAELYHQVMEYIGDRRSVVLTTHNSIVKKGHIPNFYKKN